MQSGDAVGAPVHCIQIGCFNRQGNGVCGGVLVLRRSFVSCRVVNTHVAHDPFSHPLFCPAGANTTSASAVETGKAGVLPAADNSAGTNTAAAAHAGERGYRPKGHSVACKGSPRQV
jgi:hypothetical protein